MLELIPSKFSVQDISEKTSQSVYVCFKRYYDNLFFYKKKNLKTKSLWFFSEIRTIKNNWASDRRPI